SIKKPTLYDRAILDGLTGLFTKRHIQTQLTGLFHQSRRNRTPLSIIMIDIDHFKKVNDHHGHLTGDMILQQVSHLLKQTLRRSDSAYRYGGEELMLVLPGTTLDATIPLAERIREFIEKTEFETEHNYKLRVTVSMGICEYQSEFTDYLQMVSRADQGLYLAKNSGRNRIGVYRQDKPELAA
ncbi:MAG: GGDEF domain-containing protein, partial [Planctomycetota bacterium]